MDDEIEARSGGAGNFLSTAADNRITIVDPDRWEGLQDSGDEEDDASLQLDRAQPAQPQPQPSQQGKLQVRDSGDSENEGYRMFMTQRETNQQQPPPLPPPPPLPQDPNPDPVRRPDTQEKFLETLGSRLMLRNVGDSTSDGSPLSENARSSLQQQQEQKQEQQQQQQQHFSVRKGGNQLANLLPAEAKRLPLPLSPSERQPQQQPQEQPPQPQQQPQQQLPQPQQQQAEARPKQSAPTSAAPVKEAYIGYLRLSSGQAVGPFRWSVESIETPTSLEDALESGAGRHGDSSGLFSILIDSQPTAGGQQSRQRFVTRQGRFEFLENSSALPSRDSGSLQTLAEALAALDTAERSSDVRRSGVRVSQQQLDGRLTKILSDLLSGGGASLVIACTSPAIEAHNTSSRTAKAVEQATSSVVARPPAAEVSDAASKLASEAKMLALEQQVLSLRGEVESLRSENGGLKEQLVKNSEASMAGAENQRPTSKSSYQSLYEMLQEYMLENESLRNENLDLVKHQGDRRREQDQLAKENRRLAIRLDRAQKQAAAAAAAANTSQKPLYVVSNSASAQPSEPASAGPGSSSSSSTLRAAAEQQAATAHALLTLPRISPSNHSAPALTAAAESPAARQQAFQSPVTTVSEIQQQQQWQARRQRQNPKQRHQQQQLQRQQPQQQQMLPYPAALEQQYLQQAPAAAQYYHQHLPVGPVYAQQPLPPPLMQPQQLHPAQRLQQPAAAESPLYVPKPGERTYRGRHQQQAAAGRDSHGRPSDMKAAQDVNKLNDSLKSELRQLDGAIQQHQRVNALQSDIRRNEGRKVLKTF